MVRGNQPRPTRGLKVVDHVLGLVFVFSNQDVYVVRHNRARVTRVFILFNNLRESVTNFLPRGLIETKERMFQHLGRPLVEVPDVAAGGLNQLPTVMKFAQFSNHVATDRLGPTPARVVR